MRRSTLALALALLAATALTAQVTEVPTSSRNPAGSNLDLETASGAPGAGTITGTEPYWLINNILQVSLLNQPGVWSPGDTLNYPTGGTSNTLASVGNTLSIVTTNGAMDNPSAGAGFSFQFSGPCTQFGAMIYDQNGAGITVEAYLGGVLQGSTTTTTTSTSSVHTFDILPGCDELRIYSTNGGGGWCLDDLFLVVAGSLPNPEYQENTSLMALTVDNVAGNAYFPFAISKDIYPTCGANGTQAEVGLSSDTVGTLYDIVVTGAPLVPVTGGGFQLPGLRINVDITQPYTFLYSGTPGPNFVPMPGPGLPGISGSSWEATLGLNTPGTLTLQAICLDPTAPAGLNGSNGAQIDTVAQPVPTSLAGPVNTSTNVSYNLVSSPNCWTTSGVPFYGTLFNEIFVSPNGFVAFGAGGDTDTTPSINDALNDDGRVGFWTSFDPSEGGSVDLNYSGPDQFSVDFTGVFYDAGGPGCSFSIVFDCVTGQITLDNLQGLVPNPNTTSTTDDQWMGISPGIGVPGTPATDPGAASFASNGGGGVANPGDMLYDFNDVSVSLSGLPASITAGMNTIFFIPDGTGNYTWAAF